MYISKFKLYIKLIRIGLHIISGFINLTICKNFYSRKFKFGQIHKWSKKTYKLLNIEIITHNMPDFNKDKGLMIVGNHVSWLDIFALNSISPGRFIAKSDLKKWPMLGTLVTNSETILVQRGGGNQNKGHYETIVNSLENGDQITLFPEGTTSPGNQLLNFKKRIFQAPIDAKVDILPFIIIYPNSNNKGIREDLTYYGDINFMQSLVKIAKYKKNTAHIYFLDKIPYDPNISRIELANGLYKKMDQALESILNQYSIQKV
ncbi:MAG: lysophospholipid acyltransferase family protein [Psittacicella sp.]